jgi:hypothetical protein
MRDAAGEQVTLEVSRRRPAVQPLPLGTQGSGVEVPQARQGTEGVGWGEASPLPRRLAWATPHQRTPPMR